MTRKTDFWRRVHLAFDGRRDPLEDSGVQDAIALEPELLDELLALRSRLETLPRPRGRRRLSLAAAAAAIAVAGSAIAFYFSRDSRTSVERAAQPVTSTLPLVVHNEILDFELSITTERPGLRETVVIDRTGTRRTRAISRDAFEHSTLTTEVLTPRGR